MPVGINARFLESGLALAAALLLLSACSSHEPTRAVMVPQTVNGDYGYSDRALDATRYEVTYVSPRLRADVDSDADHGLEGEKQRVYEFALWRAAQLADSKGYPAFKVAQESRDVDVTVNRQHTVPPPYFGPGAIATGPMDPMAIGPTTTVTAGPATTRRRRHPAGSPSN